MKLKQYTNTNALYSKGIEKKGIKNIVENIVLLIWFLFGHLYDNFCYWTIITKQYYNKNFGIAWGDSSSSKIHLIIANELFKMLKFAIKSFNREEKNWQKSISLQCWRIL